MAEALPQVQDQSETISANNQEQEDLVPPYELYKYFRWGDIPEEIPSENEYLLPNVSEDIKRSMQGDCLDKYPDDESIMQIKDINLPPMDPLMMYSIQLHKWMNNMIETINLTEIANEGNLVLPEDAKVPIPEMPDVKFKSQQNQLNFMPRLPPKVAKIELDLPELSHSIVRKILAKSVAVMTAHIGFDETHQSVLDTLVDVLEQFFLKICKSFVDALNQEEHLDTTGFPNVMERVLVETGLGGSKGLQDYYENRVIKYINVLQNRCKDLEQHYSSLVQRKTDSPTGEIGKWFNIKVKEEDEKISDEAGYGETDLITNEYQLLSNLECTDSFMMDTLN